MIWRNKMQQKIKIIVLLLALIGSMYYFITVKDGTFERAGSMILISAIAYYLGRVHGQVIKQGEIKYENSKSQ